MHGQAQLGRIALKIVVYIARIYPTAVDKARYIYRNVNRAENASLASGATF